MRFRVDVSEHSAVGVCSCGARFLGSSRPEVLGYLTSHERAAHPGSKNAAAERSRSRHAR